MPLLVALAMIWIAVCALAQRFPNIAGTIYGGGIAASVPIGLFLAARAQSRRQATLDLFKEYYSADFAEMRRKASKFMRKHHNTIWSANDPYKLGEGDDDLAGYSAVVRFFHRFSILYELGEINRGLAIKLFSREIGYWHGKLFEPMAARKGMFVLKSISELARRANILDAGRGFAEGYETSKRKNPPEIDPPTEETKRSISERWGEL